MAIRRMFLMVCMLGFLAVLTSGLLFYQEKQRGRQAVEKLLAYDELFRLNDYVERSVVNRLRSASTLSYAVNADEYLSRPTPAETSAMNLTLLRLQQRLGVSAVYIIDETGLTRASSNYNTAFSFIGHDFKTRDYFMTAMAGLPGQEIGLGRVSGLFGAYYSFPIIKESSAGGSPGHFLGAFVIKDAFELPLLGAAQRELAARDAGDASVVNMVGPGGRIIASNRDGWVGEVLPAQTLNGEDYRIISFEDKTYTAMSVELADFPGWHLLRLDQTRHWLVEVLSPLMTRTGTLYVLLLSAVSFGTIGLYRQAIAAVRKREHSHKRLRRSHLRYRELSYRDVLTGLYNRRSYETDLAREMLRAQRYRHPLSIAVLDIDFFKKINDAHGHGAGDRVLRQLANLIRSTIRDTDVAYRIGGEEFVVLLPETTVDDAEVVIRRIQQALLDNESSADKGIGFPVTFSCGIAIYQENETESELFERADALLYEVKTNGRNDVRTQRIERSFDPVLVNC